LKIQSPEGLFNYSHLKRKGKRARRVFKGKNRRYPYNLISGQK
jgi:hypothetical protein